MQILREGAKNTLRMKITREQAEKIAKVFAEELEKDCQTFSFELELKNIRSMESGVEGVPVDFPIRDNPPIKRTFGILKGESNVTK